MELKRYLYGDKRAPWGWQDHFKKTTLELGFERLESEPGCFVKKGVSLKHTIIVVVDEVLSVGKRKHLDNFIVKLEKTFKLKRVEFIENGKSVLFLDDNITKFKDQITLKSKGAHVDNMLMMLGMESCKWTSTPMVRKESAADGDEEMLEGSEAETYRSVLGILMYFKRHRFFRLALRGKVSGTGEFLADQGSHESENEFCATFKERETCIWNWLGPRTVDGNGCRPRRKTEVDYWWFVDAWRSVRGGLVSNAETNSVEQWLK